MTKRPLGLPQGSFAIRPEKPDAKYPSPAAGGTAEKMPLVRKSLFAVEIVHVEYRLSSLSHRLFQQASRRRRGEVGISGGRVRWKVKLRRGKLGGVWLNAGGIRIRRSTMTKRPLGLPQGSFTIRPAKPDAKYPSPAAGGAC